MCVTFLAFSFVRHPVLMSGTQNSPGLPLYTQSLPVPSQFPPFVGYVDSTLDALYLVYATRRNYLERISMRLSQAERNMRIKSGAVFIFDVEETGIKRWTDGLLWSQSRIDGNFLAYAEVKQRGLNHGIDKKYDYGDSVLKENGLIKKTITIVINGAEMHLVSYFTWKDIESGRLKTPTSRMNLMNMYLPPDIFDQSRFRYVLKINVGPDGRRYFSPEREVKKRQNLYKDLTTPTRTLPPLTPLLQLPRSGFCLASSVGSALSVSNLVHNDLTDFHFPSSSNRPPLIERAYSFASGTGTEASIGDGTNNGDLDVDTQWMPGAMNMKRYNGGHGYLNSSVYQRSYSSSSTATTSSSGSGSGSASASSSYIGHTWGSASALSLTVHGRRSGHGYGNKHGNSTGSLDLFVGHPPPYRFSSLPLLMERSHSVNSSISATSDNHDSNADASSSSALEWVPPQTTHASPSPSARLGHGHGHRFARYDRFHQHGQLAQDDHDGDKRYRSLERSHSQDSDDLAVNAATSRRSGPVDGNTIAPFKLTGASFGGGGGHGGHLVGPGHRYDQDLEQKYEIEQEQREVESQEQGQRQARERGQRQSSQSQSYSGSLNGGDEEEDDKIQLHAAIANSSHHNGPIGPAMDWTPGGRGYHDLWR
ncbi:hypothetical protein D9758_015801 [Tetrapyrgos nigripes]|uniref:Gti1/Pac2 family-domain-containing protein n=1 Tax=Tetrapyrgos nigripes TaxID=182062 RepID=A0A8H5BXE3_9AGAR|nr:hypothetical protein D9758_015801 [Tetrapyrgos nigripes]